MMNFSFDYIDAKQLVYDALVNELPKLGQPVKVLKSDPATAAEFPCVGINRISDDETNQTLGDFVGVSYVPETRVYTTSRGSYFSEAIEIRVWHTNADERDKLYQTVRAILFAYRMSFVETGLLNVALRTGVDEQDNTMQNAPVIIYWSSLTMTYLSPLAVDILTEAELIEEMNVDNTPTTQGG